MENSVCKASLYSLENRDTGIYKCTIGIRAYGAFSKIPKYFFYLVMYLLDTHSPFILYAKLPDVARQRNNALPGSHFPRKDTVDLQNMNA